MMKPISSAILALFVLASVSIGETVSTNAADAAAAPDIGLLKQYKGRLGWQDPEWEWFWLFANPRKIAPDFYFGDDPFIDNAIRVNPKTSDFLYKDGGQFTPLKFQYVPGSRPVLEEVARHLTAGLKSDREKAESILKWVGAFRVKSKTNAPDIFMPDLSKMPADHNAVEYVIARKGSSCEWMSRLFVSVCQVCGIPVRLIIRVVHTQAEANLDGQWRMYDPLYGDHGEESLQAAPGGFAELSAAQAYAKSGCKDEFSLANFFIGEEYPVRRLDLRRAKTGGNITAQSGRFSVEPKVLLEEKFDQESLALSGPIPTPFKTPGWTLGRGAWKIADHKLKVAFDPKSCFIELSRIHFENIQADAGLLKVKINRSHWGEKTRGVAGIALNSREDAFMGVALFDETAIQVFKVEGQRYTLLRSFPGYPRTRQDEELEVRLGSNSLAIRLDGKYIGEWKGAMLPGGKPGLLATCDTAFDDLAILAPGAGQIVSEDIPVLNLIRWERLIVDRDGEYGAIACDYSTDGGASWQPVPEDGDLSFASPAAKKIRFRVSLGGESCGAPVLCNLFLECRTTDQLKF